MIIHDFLELFGVRVERRPSLPGVIRVATAMGISRIFDGDVARLKLQHEIDMAGGPLIETNDRSLGCTGVYTDGKFIAASSVVSPICC